MGEQLDTMVFDQELQDQIQKLFNHQKPVRFEGAEITEMSDEFVDILKF